MFIEDILNNKQPKKNTSSKKGKRGERSLCKILSSRFNKPFSRTLGSGNRWSQTSLTETAKKIFTGDIICPDEFNFIIESKHGYSSVNIEKSLSKGNKLIDGFLKQCIKDSERSGKTPLLCWKQNHKPWLVFIKSNLPGKKYLDWTVVTLDFLLSQPDEFFFNNLH